MFLCVISAELYTRVCEHMYVCRPWRVMLKILLFSFILLFCTYFSIYSTLIYTHFT